MAQSLAEPGTLDRPIREVMDPPFPVVDADLPVDRLTTLLSRGTAGGAGAARGHDHRHRHPLRRAPSGRGDPVMRVTVLTGGTSPERDVAFAVAAQVVAALREPRPHGARGGHDAGSCRKARRPGCSPSGVGRRTPTDVGDLVSASGRCSATASAKLPAVRDADVLFLSVHGGRGRGRDGAGGARRGRRAVHRERAAWRPRSPWTRTSPSGCSETPASPVPAWVMAPVSAGGRDHRARMARASSSRPAGLVGGALAGPERERARPGDRRSRRATTTT